MTTKFAVIGPGRVGQEVIRQAQSLGWEFAGALGRTAIHLPPVEMPLAPHVDQTARVEKFLESIDDTDIVFVTTPPFADEGFAELETLCVLSEYHVPTVICTKEALAYRPQSFRERVLPYFHGKFACSASFGGRVGIMDYVRSYLLEGVPVSIDIAPNASTNIIFSRIAREGLEKACEAAQEMGCLEPGNGDWLAKINRELLDGMLKACVFFNQVLARNEIFITPNDSFDVYPQQLSEKDLRFIESCHNPHALTITFSNFLEPCLHESGAFRTRRCGEWWISGGVTMFDVGWVPGGPSAAICIRENGSKVPTMLSGEGAGYKQTAERMILDAKRILGRKLREENEQLLRSTLRKQAAGLT